MHPFHRVRFGEATLLLYQSRVWAHWHNHIKANKGFEIHVINNTKLNICMVEVADTVHTIGEQTVCTSAHILFNNLLIVPPLPILHRTLVSLSTTHHAP